MNLPPAVPKPCDECPFVRTSVPGHLGPYTAEEWAFIAHGEAPIACHKTIKDTEEVDGQQVGSWDHPKMKQCQGAAIFRANILKSPRDPEVAKAEPNKETVFAWDDEMVEHHTSKAGERFRAAEQRRADLRGSS